MNCMVSMQTAEAFLQYGRLLTIIFYLLKFPITGYAFRPRLNNKLLGKIDFPITRFYRRLRSGVGIS